VTINKLISSKVELYKNKNALEDQIDGLRQRSGIADSNIQVLQQDNSRIETFLGQHAGGSYDINESNVDSLVYLRDPFSAKYTTISL
jgi:hypothetical protein